MADILFDISTCTRDAKRRNITDDRSTIMHTWRYPINRDSSMVSDQPPAPPTKKLALILPRFADDVHALIPDYVCVHPRTRWSTGIRPYPDKRHRSVPLWFNIEPLICTLYLLSGRLGHAESAVPHRKFATAIHYGLSDAANQPAGRLYFGQVIRTHRRPAISRTAG